MSAARRVARWAERYCELGLALTWTPPGEKGPRHTGWNRPENAITDPKVALEFWSAHPDYGIGALMGPSRKVSLDVDHVPCTRMLLSGLGIDLDAIEAPRIIGNPEKFRLMFEAPAGVELRHRTAVLPQQDDPRKSFAAFELRAGPVSDALPPSIHATTRRPYRFAVLPRGGFPPAPSRLLELWTDWPTTEKRLRALCPWAPPPKSIPERRALRREYGGPSVIQAFNEAHDIVAILESFGYQRRDKRRFASPGTGHAAGVVLLDDRRIFCHHAGDILHDAHALDCFDIYARLEHQGNVRAAVKAAALALGLDRERAA